MPPSTEGALDNLWRLEQQVPNRGAECPVTTKAMRSLLDSTTFRHSLRGYSSGEVDTFLEQLRSVAAPCQDDALECGDASAMAATPIGSRDIRTVQFRLSLRGYDVDEVDAFLERLAQAFDRADGRSA